MNGPFSPGLLERLPETPRKVAVLRASRIGDFICATPAFRALRAALPQAELTIITLPLLEDLARRSPYFDRFAAFPGFPGLAEQFFDARRAAAFFQEMQAQSFDLAVQMQGSGVYSNPFTLLLGAKTTAGFVRPGDPAGRLDAALPFPYSGHEVQRVLALTSFLGAAAQGQETEFPLWRQDRQAASAILAGLEPPLIGVHASARDRSRQWPPERFAAVVTGLLDRCGGTALLLGEAADREWAAQLLEGTGGNLVDLVGRTRLGALGAVVDRLSVLVTNDSGPAHIAYALGTPAVTIFGGGDLERYRALQDGPFRMLVHPVPCRPCSVEECPIGYDCLVHVSVEQVIAAADEIIKTKTPRYRTRAQQT